MLGLESDPLLAIVPFQPSSDSHKNQLGPPFGACSLQATISFFKLRPPPWLMGASCQRHDAFSPGRSAACLSEVPRCLHGGRPEGGEKSGLLVFLPDRICSGGGGGGGWGVKSGGGGRLRLRGSAYVGERVPELRDPYLLMMSAAGERRRWSAGRQH